MRLSIVIHFPRMHRGPSRHLAKAVIIGLVLVVFCLLTERRQGLAATCKSSPSPIVSMEVTTGDVQEVFDVTAADLKRAAAAMGAQAHQPSLAAYSSDLAYAGNIVENAQHVSGDLHCATLTSVHVVVALKNRIIHLARELQQNRCIEKSPAGTLATTRARRRQDSRGVSSAFSTARCAFAVTARRSTVKLGGKHPDNRCGSLGNRKTDE
jgi:hypothetical protein